MKKTLIVILIIVLISLIVLLYNYEYEVISDDTLVSSETITNFNKQFEDFPTIQNYSEMKGFLEFCMTNCEYYRDESAFVPNITYKSNSWEIFLVYERENNFEDTEYYIGLKELIEVLSENKSYNIEFEYIEVREDRPKLLKEININEIEE